MPCQRFHGKVCQRAKFQDYAKVVVLRVNANLSPGIGEASDNLTLVR